MASVHDVVAYILEEFGRMATGNLHRCLFYCQGWHLAWDRELLFEEYIEARDEGPIVPDIWNKHGPFAPYIEAWPDGKPENLSIEQTTTIDVVVPHYDAMPSSFLIDLSRREGPYRRARETATTANPNPQISYIDMSDHFLLRLELMQARGASQQSTETGEAE